MLALAVYLTQSQLLPYQHTAELFQELAGIALSPGTLQRAVTVAATHLEAPVAAIRAALLTAPVAHADETAEALDTFGLLEQLRLSRLKYTPVAGVRAKISLKMAQMHPAAPNITVKPVVPIAYLSAKNARRKKRKNSL